MKVGKEGGFQDDNEREERKMAVMVTLLPAKREKLASTFVEHLAESIYLGYYRSEKDIISKAFQRVVSGRVNQKASSKHHLTHDYSTKMEEIAEERRRRWQRSNPNAGSYRPSGQIQKNALSGGPSRAF